MVDSNKKLASSNKYIKLMMDQKRESTKFEVQLVEYNDQDEDSTGSGVHFQLLESIC